MDSSTESSTAEPVDPGTAFLIEAFDPLNRTDPYDLYARMRTTHPALEGGAGLWFTFTHRAAHSLLRAPNVSSDERRSNEFQANLGTDPPLSEVRRTRTADAVHRSA